MTQARIGWRAFSGSQSISTLLTSLYSSWNGDVSASGLNTSIYGAWNGEANNNIAVKNAWNANGDATDSKGGANGTVAIPSGTSFTTGTMTYGSGKLGSGSFTFDGTNFINLPNNTLNFTGDFTIGCWFYVPTNYVANGSLISAFDNKSSYPTYYGWNFGYDSTNKNIGFSVSNPAGGSYANVSLSTPNNSIVPGQWNHVAVTRKSSTRSRIYINGVLSASNTSTLNPVYNFGLAYIGAIFYGFQQPFYNKPNAGLKIDAIYTFESELDSTAISELYNSGNGQEYPFTISNTLIDSPKDSVGTNHGTLMNGCTYTTGKVGNAFSFDGINDYVHLGDVMDIGLGSWSYAFWFKVPTTTGQIIFSKSIASGVVGRFWSTLTSNKLDFNLMSDGYGTITITSTTTISANVWYHCALVVDRSDKLKMYINGNLETVVNTGRTNNLTSSNVENPNLSSSNYNTLAPFRIGAYTSADTITATSFFIGQIDAFTIWNRAINIDDVSQLYNGGSGVQYPYTNSLVASSKNSFGIDNGTLMNGCSVTDGKIGKAFTFDGVNDYVQLPDNSLNFTSDFSVSAWIYVSNLSGEKYIISNSNGDIFNVNTGWCFGVFDNKVSFWVYPGGSTYTGWLTNTTLSLNTWYHVSVTKKPTQSPLLYINGVLSSTSLYNNNMANSLNPVYSTTTYPNTKASIGVFRYNNGSSAYAYWNGKIDALNVWKKELTQAEVTELYNSGNGKQIVPTTTIVTDGLVLNLDASRTSSYPGSGTTWTDISGNSNNGTLVSGPIFGTANGGGITFDGVNDRITLQNANISATGNWTISTWFNLSALNLDLVNGAPAVLYSQYAPNPGNGRFLLMVRNDGTITNKFQLFLGSGTGYSNQPITGTTTVQINTTYNLVAIRNGSVFSLYLNGNLEASLDLTGTNISLLQNTSEIGGVSNGNFGWVNGKIYNTMVYNRALSATEIGQNYNATKTRFGL
jgi:hypothetical protein